MSLLRRVLLLALAVSSLFSLAAPRAIPPVGARLATRLADEKAGLVDCWNALTELRSCTNEIVLFFLNGESYLTIGCCRAIRVITRNCWPTMLDSLGFTSQEADILRGYCDAETAAPPPSPLLSAPPAVAPAGAVGGSTGYGVGEIGG